MPAAEKHIGIIYNISSSSAIAFMDDSVASMERTLGGKVTASVRLVLLLQFPSAR